MTANRREIFPACIEWAINLFWETISCNETTLYCAGPSPVSDPSTVTLPSLPPCVHNLQTSQQQKREKAQEELKEFYLAFKCLSLGSSPKMFTKTEICLKGSGIQQQMQTICFCLVKLNFMNDRQDTVLSFFFGGVWTQNIERLLGNPAVLRIKLYTPALGAMSAVLELNFNGFCVSKRRIGKPWGLSTVSDWDWVSGVPSSS